MLLMGATQHLPRGLRNGETQALGREIPGIMVKHLTPFCSSKGKDVSEENKLPWEQTGSSCLTPGLAQPPEYQDLHQPHGTKARLPLHLPEKYSQKLIVKGQLKRCSKICRGFNSLHLTQLPFQALDFFILFLLRRDLYVPLKWK